MKLILWVGKTEDLEALVWQWLWCLRTVQRHCPLHPQLHSFEMGIHHIQSLAPSLFTPILTWPSLFWPPQWDTWGKCLFFGVHWFRVPILSFFSSPGYYCVLMEASFYKRRKKKKKAAARQNQHPRTAESRGEGGSFPYTLWRVTEYLTGERFTGGKNHTGRFNTQEGNQGEMKGTETKVWFVNGFLEVEWVWEKEQLVDEIQEGKGGTA